MKGNKFPKTVLFDDNPMTKIFNEKTKQHNELLTNVEQCFYDAHIAKLLDLPLINKINPHSERWISVIMFKNTKEVKSELHKMNFKRFCDDVYCGNFIVNNIAGYKYNIYAVKSDEEIFKNISDKSFIVSHSYYLNKMEEYCINKHISYKRDAYDFEIMW